MTHITVGAIAPRIQYIADGTQTVFSYPFAIFKSADMEVYLGDTLQSGGVAVAGAGQSGGGTVTFDTAPAKARLVTLRRRLEIARTTDFQPNGAFRARVLNDELDYQTAALQQVSEEVSRAVRRAPTSAAAAAPSLILPEAEANRVIGWNGEADALENKAQKVTGVTVGTLAQGARASASYDDVTGLITLGLPMGPTGRRGPRGAHGNTPVFYGLKITNGRLRLDTGTGDYASGDYVWSDFKSQGLTFAINTHGHLTVTA